MIGGVALAAVAAFNLVCVSLGEAPSKAELRIDLSKKRLCRDKCAGTYPIFSANSYEIVLAHEREAEWEWWEKVNRETGAYISYFKSDGTTPIIVTSNCKKARFGGFPASRF